MATSYPIDFLIKYTFLKKICFVVVEIKAATDLW